MYTTNIQETVIYCFTKYPYFRLSKWINTKIRSSTVVMKVKTSRSVTTCITTSILTTLFLKALLFWMNMWTSVLIMLIYLVIGANNTLSQIPEQIMIDLPINKSGKIYLYWIPHSSAFRNSILVRAV